MSILAHAPIEVKTDFFIGRQMYGQGVGFEQCTTVRMRSGWLTAENIAEWAEFNRLMAEKRPPTVEAEFDEEMEQIEAERLGGDFNTKPWNY